MSWVPRALPRGNLKAQHDGQLPARVYNALRNVETAVRGFPGHGGQHDPSCYWLNGQSNATHRDTALERSNRIDATLWSRFIVSSGATGTQITRSR